MDEYTKDLENQNTSLREKLAETEEKLDKLQKELDDYKTPVITSSSGNFTLNDYTISSCNPVTSIYIEEVNGKPTIRLGDVAINDDDLDFLKKLKEKDDYRKEKAEKAKEIKSEIEEGIEQSPCEVSWDV
jgi:predicted RNase H-like nuclease (RuvC/YqgF family)